MARRTPAKKATGPTPVEAVEHKDRRLNIPTGQQAHLVDAHESANAVVPYPRDPALDPQLVWKGKDEQNREDLVVPAVPIYIQEKIDPRALIENLRDTAARSEDEPELRLFADYDGMQDLDALDKVDFYQHEGNWQNRMILGDSMVVMTSLAEKENLRGKVQTVFVDPPYGISFGSNWQISTRKNKVADGKAADATREPEVVKAFRDTWELGIHSYLSYLRDRLVVARDLLTETGSCFVQIGDENVHRVRAVMDEVFGDINFVSLITFKKTSAVGSFSGGTTTLAGTADYVVWFAKNKATVRYNQLFRDKDTDGPGGGAYRTVELPDGSRRPATKDERASGVSAGRFLRPSPMTSDMVRENQTTVFPVTLSGHPRPFDPGKKGWKTNREGMERLRWSNRLMASGDSLAYVRYLDDFPAFPLTNLWDDTQSGSSMDKVYVVQTNTKVIERCLLMTTDPGDLVLDPTCGSGTTAFVAEQWGRRWITVDTSRVALALARTRLMSAKYPYYLLADSSDGGAKEEELTQQLVPGPFTDDIKRGFVYKRVPHITLKSIAQNPEVKEGMDREAIVAAIRRHADTELLVDQPYVDTKRVRVTGRFTVESLSPHRLLEPGDGTEAKPAASIDVVQFQTLILDNLRKAGVQNGAKGERLTFEQLEPVAGEWLQAGGTFREADDTTRRVVVSIGPEFGTVGAEQVALAAQEATRGIPADVLLVTGFAFDPQAWAKAKEINPDVAERSIGRLRVLLVRANSDLSMGDELLKKTGAGNLFTVFGEPDIDIRIDDAGHVVVELHGLDVYDPTTGEVRPSSVDDVAAWFIDTDYDSTSFFVRHAYFTGGQQPYESLAKTLRADIDADAWASLYSTVSRPFAAPTTGRIAVKVINHYGDEILQVYEVPQKH